MTGENCSQSGQLRLAATSSVNITNAGRVEICLEGVWGTIAADSIVIPWSEKNAQVACIELGFSGALNVILQATYIIFMKDVHACRHATVLSLEYHCRIPFTDRSNSAIHLSAVACNGTERNISDCPHSTSSQNVDHGYDACVVCRPRHESRYSGTVYNIRLHCIIVCSYVYTNVNPCCSCSSWWGTVWRHTTIW